VIQITVIHGQIHKGSTYRITKEIIDKIPNTDKEIYEYFMPIDTPNYCVGCYKCFYESENNCPHAEKVQRIIRSMEVSDIILIDSPTYCYGMTGQLKTFFDHLGYMWLPHRPNKEMFNKVGIVVSSAAGGGANKVTKLLAQQMFYIGIPKVFRYSKNVNAFNWQTVPEKIKQAIELDSSKLSLKVKSKVGKVRPTLKLKFIFNIMRMMQKSNDWNVADHNYWKNNGWLDKKRPWK
jgi:multimeric flavodoxin WrbA